MEVKPGYKKTEVGVIPEEWDAKPLKGRISIAHGFAFSGEHFEDHGPYRLTTPGHFYEEGGFRDIGEKQKFYDSPVPSDYVLRPGDMIVAMTEQADGLLGSAAFIPEVQGYLHNQRLGRINAVSSQVDLGFLFYTFNSLGYRAKVRETAVGTKVKHASPEKLLEIPVRLPPLPEQRLIAGALSHVDALLGSLEKLIAKKRDLKQAAMQQLLTGKKRLPGFSGEWEVKQLGDVATLYQPVMISASQFTASGYPVYGANGIVGFFGKFNHDTWQITITCRGSTCGTVNRTVEKCWITGNAMVINCDRSNWVDKAFIYYLLTFQDLSICVTGTGQPQIVRSPLASCELRVPNGIEEQTAIAEVLSDMDAELAALEQRLAKTRDLKQGMMQDLLTGRTRLV